MNKNNALSDLGKSILILIASFGGVLLWRGLWELSDLWFDTKTCILLGLLILAVLAVIERKTLFHHLD